MPLPPIATVPVGKTQITFTEDAQGWHFHRWLIDGTKRIEIDVEPKDRLRRFPTPRDAADWFRANYGEKFGTTK